MGHNLTLCIGKLWIASGLWVAMESTKFRTHLCLEEYERFKFGDSRDLPEPWKPWKKLWIRLVAHGISFTLDHLPDRKRLEQGLGTGSEWNCRKVWNVSVCSSRFRLHLFSTASRASKTVIALLAIVCITCFRDTEIAAPMISIHNLKQLYLDPQWTHKNLYNCPIKSNAMNHVLSIFSGSTKDQGTWEI